MFRSFFHDFEITRNPYNFWQFFLEGFEQKKRNFEKLTKRNFFLKKYFNVFRKINKFFLYEI